MAKAASIDQKPPVSRPRQLSLLQIMIALIYFAVLSWAGRLLYQHDGDLERSILGVILGLGVALVGLLTVIRRPRFAFLGWLLFLAGYIVVTAATTAYRFGPSPDSGWMSLNGLKSVLVTSFLMMPTLGILIGAIVYLNRRRRSDDQDALIWVMTIAADRGMPLSPGILALSSQLTGTFQVWTETLAVLVSRGIALPDAIEELPRMLPNTSRLLIRMGTESGNLSRGLRESVEARAIRLPLFRAILGQIAYLAGIACIAVAICGYLLFFVLRHFEAIFRDFRIELPESTRQVIAISNQGAALIWVPALLLPVVLIWVMIRSFLGRDLTLSLVDRLFSRRHTILILRGLVLFVEGERPIARALEVLARDYPVDWVRKKLAVASIDVAQGHAWLDALRSLGLLRASDVGVLASAQRSGNLAWAIRELILTSERRWGYRLQGFMQLLFIAAMLSLGVLVLFLGIAYFSPLITLILRLSQ